MRVPRPDDRSRTTTSKSPADVGTAFALLLGSNPHATWVCDLESLQVLEANDAAAKHVGRSHAAMLSSTLLEFHLAQDHERLRRFVCDARVSTGRWRQRRGDGEVIEVELTAQHLTWNGQAAVLIMACDLRKSAPLEASATPRGSRERHHGFANPAMFMQQVDQAVATAHAHGKKVGVLMVGLDDLEMLAAIAGEQVGEEIVRVVARRLASHAAADTVVAQLARNRFALLQTAPQEHSLLVLASALTCTLEEPIELGQWGELMSAASVGIAIGPGESDRSAASLVADATTAMRRAGELGPGRFVRFDAELRASALGDLTISRDLANAARLGQLRLQYQPIVALDQGGIVACEALVRWERPGIGLVGPSGFIALAERRGLMVELGAWVIEHALAEAARWQARTGWLGRVAVNLSAHQLHDGHLVQRFESACAAAGLPPSALCVELTESDIVTATDQQVRRTLAELRAQGIEIAIDDFGTGYSALAYLKQLPVDVVKIDRSFVADLGAGIPDAVIVDAMIGIAHGLGLRVIAEGVETPEQLTCLRRSGCDEAQGFLFARPVDVDELPQAFSQATRIASGGPGAAGEPAFGD